MDQANITMVLRQIESLETNANSMLQEIAELKAFVKRAQPKPVLTMHDFNPTREHFTHLRENFPWYISEVTNVARDVNMVLMFKLVNRNTKEIIYIDDTTDVLKFRNTLNDYRLGSSNDVFLTLETLLMVVGKFAPEIKLHGYITSTDLVITMGDLGYFNVPLSKGNIEQITNTVEALGVVIIDNKDIPVNKALNFECITSFNPEANTVYGLARYATFDTGTELFRYLDSHLFNKSTGMLFNKIFVLKKPTLLLVEYKNEQGRIYSRYILSIREPIFNGGYQTFRLSSDEFRRAKSMLGDKARFYHINLS